MSYDIIYVSFVFYTRLHLYSTELFRRKATQITHRCLLYYEMLRKIEATIFSTINKTRDINDDFSTSSLMKLLIGVCRIFKLQA